MLKTSEAINMLVSENHTPTEIYNLIANDREEFVGNGPYAEGRLIEFWEYTVMDIFCPAIEKLKSKSD